MAFTTGNLFVVLPMLMEKAKELFVEYEETKKGKEYIDILVPVAFNFPNMGKLIALLFVLFGAWFIGSPIPVSSYPRFLSTGMVTFFGGIDMALPFMLSFMGLPADLFNIYSVSGVINGRFATLLACMELISITLITGIWLSGKGKIKINIKRLAVNILILVISCLGMLIALKKIQDKLVPSAEDRIAQLQSMHMNVKSQITVHEPGSVPPSQGHHLINLISKKSKTIRVGYFPKYMPFSYFNKNHELVGLDIEMIVSMAADMNAQIEFYPVSLTNVVHYLKDDLLDIVPGITINSSDIKSLYFSDTYTELTLGMVVTKDTKRKIISDRDDFFAKPNLDVALIKPNPYITAFKIALPDIRMHYISSPTEFYTAPKDRYALMLTSMEAGSVWNMLYPGFDILPIKNGSLKKELVIASSGRNAEVIRQINEWMRLKKSQHFFDMLYDYWVRGMPRNSFHKPPRWCIMRNVLGWGVKDKTYE